MNNPACEFRKPRAARFLFLAVLWGLAACAPLKAYDGDPLPPERVASIDWSGIRVKALNGKLPGSASSAEVLPGEQIVTLVHSPNLGLTTFSKTLTFEAKAGHSYVLRAECGSFLNCKPFWAWVEDLKAGTTVAGRSPE